MSEKFRARQFSNAQGLGKRQTDLTYRLAKTRVILGHNGRQLSFIAELMLSNVLMTSSKRLRNKKYRKALKYALRGGLKR